MTCCLKKPKPISHQKQNTYISKGLHIANLYSQDKCHCTTEKGTKIQIKKSSAFSEIYRLPLKCTGHVCEWWKHNSSGIGPTDKTVTALECLQDLRPTSSYFCVMGKKTGLVINAVFSPSPWYMLTCVDLGWKIHKKICDGTLIFPPWQQGTSRCSYYGQVGEAHGIISITFFHFVSVSMTSHSNQKWC